ncbi:MAG: cysteine desulfurase [Thermoplasmata archaeon]|nr:cysteine desulfurase [Thermoplasmata archaeon]
MNRIYLDNNLTTPLTKEVLEEMKPFFTHEFGVSSGLYEGSLRADEAIERAQQQVAMVINAAPEEITMTASGSEANLIAVRGLAQARKGIGKHLITSVIEHPSVLDLSRQLEKEGYEVDYLRVDRDGFVNPKELKEKLRKDTTLVSIMFVNHITGTIEPLEEIVRVIREYNRKTGAKVLFHTDACEAFGKLPFDAKKIGVDALSMSSHMIHGPRGAGGLYLRKGLAPEPVIHGSDSRFNYRKGSENVPAIVGFGKAAELARIGVIENLEKVRGLQDLLMRGIEKHIPDVMLNGPRGEKRSPYNVNYTFRYVEGEALTLQLDMHGIAVATGSACASRTLQTNYVLMAMGRRHEDAHGSLRFTFNRYNTREEILQTIEAIKKAFDTLVRISSVKPAGLEQAIKTRPEI